MVNYRKRHCLHRIWVFVQVSLRVRFGLSFAVLVMRVARLCKGFMESSGAAEGIGLHDKFDASLARMLTHLALVEADLGKLLLLGCAHRCHVEASPFFAEPI